MTYARLYSVDRGFCHEAVGGVRALGQAGTTPYDFNDPLATIELKRALVALAERDSDPLNNPADPIRERIWKKIVVAGEHAASWDGPTADEFVTAISRYAPGSGVAGPYMFLQAGGTGKYGIVGGPQPTAAGLEVIAGAVQTRLGGFPAMSKYLTWRGGVFPPPSTVSSPPSNAVVLPNKRPGPFWQKDGYTTVWEGGDPQWVQAVAQLDDSLVSCWQQQIQLATEETRLMGLDMCILPTRESRDTAARKANKGVAVPACPEYHEWDAVSGKCVKMKGVVDLPEVVPTEELCIQAYVDEGKSKREARSLCHLSEQPFLATIGGALLLGATVGGAAWYLQRRRAKAQKGT